MEKGVGFCTIFGSGYCFSTPHPPMRLSGIMVLAGKSLQIFPGKGVVGKYQAVNDLRPLPRGLAELFELCRDVAFADVGNCRCAEREIAL